MSVNNVTLPYVAPRDNIFHGLPIISTRGNGFGANSSLSNGTDLLATTRSLHQVMANATELRLVFANFYQGASIGLNPITVTAGLEPVATIPGGLPLGTTFGLSFNGASSVTIQPGCYAISDPVPFSVTAGQYIYCRTCVSVATSGQQWGTDLYVYPGSYEGVLHGSNGVASTVTIPTSNEASYSPMAIIGTNPTAKSWTFVGDSIINGAGDNVSINLGYAVRAAERDSVGYMQVSRPGEQLVSFVTSPSYFYRLPQAVACTRAIEAYGTNDFSHGQTLIQLQANKLIVWGWLAARGIPVYTVTVVPQTTSTDGFATLANQTPTSSNSIRVAYNTWIRAGAPILGGVAVAIGTPGAIVIGQPGHPVTKFYDVANAVESGWNSGLWNVWDVRIVNDAAITASSNVLTSATAVFATADKYSDIAITGAAASGGVLITSIGGITNGTTVALVNPIASTTVSAAKLAIGTPSQDGTHPSPQNHIRMMGALNLKV